MTTQITQRQWDAFEERMAVRSSREKDSSVLEETEEQRQARLTAAYMKRTGRTTFTSAGTGKGPRLVEK